MLGLCLFLWMINFETNWISIYKYVFATILAKSKEKTKALAELN